MSILSSLCTVALLVATASTAPAARVIHVDVDASGANDGTSWIHAFTELAPALAVAVPGDQVWVAEGLYLPSTTLDRSATFLVPTSVWLIGGFAGHETVLAQRVGLFDTTILSGDLRGDDGPAWANVGDNSYHVVTQDLLVAGIDGFTIQGGNAEGADGGGLYGSNLGSCPVLNCTFRSNRADRRGGALFQDPADSTVVRDCLFEHNHAGLGGGAAWAVPLSGLGPRFESCRFLGNTTDGAGGALFVHAWAIVNCAFSGNSAEGAAIGGGAIYAPFSPGRIVGSTLVGNSALGSTRGGGGILAGYGAHATGSVMWGNIDDDGSEARSQLRIVEPLLGFSSVDRCCIQGWTQQSFRSSNVVVSDPRFVDADGVDDVLGTTDDDLRLRFASPCVDTGADDPDLPLVDLGGAPRRVDALACDLGGVVDMGAYERSTVDGTTRFCTQPASSLGDFVEIGGPCVASVAAGRVTLFAGPVPSSMGVYMVGTEAIEVLAGNGTLCVGGNPVLFVAQPRADFLLLELDLRAATGSPIVQGTTWVFQAAFRDGGSIGFSSAKTVTVLD